MSTVVIGGGPRPQARIVQVTAISSSQVAISPSYEIRDGKEILAELNSLDHAIMLLKIIQEGE